MLIWSNRFLFIDQFFKEIFYFCINHTSAAQIDSTNLDALTKNTADVAVTTRQLLISHLAVNGLCGCLFAYVMAWMSFKLDKTLCDSSSANEFTQNGQHTHRHRHLRRLQERQTQTSATHDLEPADLHRAYRKSGLLCLVLTGLLLCASLVGHVVYYEAGIAGLGLVLAYSEIVQFFFIGLCVCSVLTGYAVPALVDGEAFVEDRGSAVRPRYLELGDQDLLCVGMVPSTAAALCPVYCQCMCCRNSRPRCVVDFAMR